MRQDRRASMLRAGIDIATMPISYTGTMTDELVTMSGTAYRLLTLLSSGTLSIDAELTADVCVCSGGTSGVAAYKTTYPTAGAGGAGGFMLNYYGTSIYGTKVAIIGAGGASYKIGGAFSSAMPASSPYFSVGAETVFDGLSSGNGFVFNANVPALSGGTGGGAGWIIGSYTTYYAATGDGLSKHPFGDSVIFPEPLCGGGGGGGGIYCPDNLNSVREYDGGAGGTNGGGGGRITTDSGDAAGGIGGIKGGGRGGSGGGPGSGLGDFQTAATYYGGGGGGGAAIWYPDMDEAYYIGGAAGYQGVIYVRIPLKQ